MSKKPNARLLLLEALMRIGPSTAIALLPEAGVPKGSLYVSLEKMLDAGHVSSEGEGEKRIWTITEDGKAVAHAMRILEDAG